MRIVPQAMTDAWLSENKTGPTRPVVRATIQVANLRKFDYDTAWADGGSYEADRHRRGVFTSMLFGDKSPLRELRNIQTCSWERSIDQDVATCTLTLLNSEMSPIGNIDEGNPTQGSTVAEKPGHMTYNRGTQTISQNRWGFDTETGWEGILVPDRLVKTYEGYGADMTVTPENDPNLVQSGTWLIDRVNYTDTGEITLEMRDLGRLLLQQIVFPPVVPNSEYPLFWSKIRNEQVPARDCVGGSWTGDDLRPIASAESSNDKYVGEGLTNAPYANYVGAAGQVQGHRAGHALEFDDSAYWLSTGQDGRSSKVWWQVIFDDKQASVGAVRLSVKGGPYRVYVSVHNGDKWMGKRNIDYEVTTGDVDINAGIKFVATGIADRSGRFDIVFPRAYKDVKKIRITFSHLEDNGIGEHPWQGALRFMRAYVGTQGNSLSFQRGTVLKTVGNYRDFTDIVKWTCAWAGFFWPPNSTGSDFVRVSNASGSEYKTITYDSADNTLPKGRVWGDFMKSGTAGEADLGVEMFDKKPLMDIVSHIRDLLGFVFFVDETGGIVWRMPNLWSKGNYISPTKMGKYSRARTTDFVTIDEEQTLLSYSTTLNSENIRERIFVGNVTGKIGTVIKGFNPFPVGLRRIAGWTDQHFETKRETRVMADMINARSMFEYRRSEVTIPGYPAIQTDDQIRIFERVTNETFHHYVLGISSSMDVASGEWTYTVSTHWLGERPSDAWAVRVEELDGATQNYINLTGGS